MNIVLHQPEIPANTGNIGRTCVATGTKLHLIEPLGFHLDEKSVKRAGMDYWDRLDVARYVNYDDFMEKTGLTDPVSTDRDHTSGEDRPHIWYATTKARRLYSDVTFGVNDYIMFGRESAGIPEEILVQNEPFCIRIPMLETIRSLNLSNSVAIVLYEALRQQGFAGLKEFGELHHLNWR
jgi:tRNA (cytidine/uridine-2'-O-)-methyltransferase